MNTKMRLIAATSLTALLPLALSQAQGSTSAPTANSGQMLVATKIASNFTALAGSPDNALALTNALRNGTDVTLTTVVPPPEGSTEPPTTTTTTFTPPTGKMGWGNVKHALALAQDALARAGVTHPTADQLEAALVGGDVVVTNADGTTTTTTLKGVLTMRAAGMGWGNIAQAGGTKLGPVTSKVKMGNVTGSASITTPTGDVSTGGAKAMKGITTAVGASSSGAAGLVTADGATSGHAPRANAYGRGIVTAAGGGVTHVGATMGGGKPAGAGVVNAGGNAGGSAGGNGNANGKGNGKGGP